MKLEWDFSELFDFADRLQDLSRFDRFAERAIKDISKALLSWMKSYTPVDSYELINGWDDASKIVVNKTDEGYEVLLVNKVKYALPVNDGHKAYNQYGGPYPIKHRVQVRSPHKWQLGDGTWYVYGHFFVERGIVRLADTKQIEEILMRELEKWWDDCLNG